MTAYYNEIEPKAAAWLRELIRHDLIAPGDVDERSIEDVRPDDLRGYTQCHFFAGIGVWSYALRGVGWPDDRPVWTGSCPCQPFSAAGKGGGFADERHLWPHFHHLIRERKPSVVLGEQVASKDGLGWFDLVQADLEGSGYAAGAVDLCAAGVGAPHIRQRLWWAAERLADADGRDASAERQQPSGEQRQQPEDGGVGILEHAPRDGRFERRAEPGGRGAASRCGVGGLGDDDDTRLEGQRGRHQAASGWVGEAGPASAAGEPGGMGNTSGQPSERDARGVSGAQGGSGSAGRTDGPNDYRYSDAGAAGGLADDLLQQRPDGQPGKRAGDDASGWVKGSTAVAGLCGDLRPGPTNGFWRDADWLFCRDGKWRPVEPDTFPLAHGAAERLGRLRGYGNAIVAPAAQAFIEAYLESKADRHLRLTEAYDLTTDNGGIFG